MKKHTRAQPLPLSIYIVLISALCANAIVTFIMFRYFM